MNNLADLARRVRLLGDSSPYAYGVAVKFLEAGEEVLINADYPFFLASIRKTPTMIAALQLVDAGQLDMDAVFTMQPRHRVTWGIVLGYLREGLQLRLRDLLTLMIIISDSTATEMVLELVGGPAGVTAAMRRLGFAENDLNLTMDGHQQYEEVLGTLVGMTRAEEALWVRQHGMNLTGEIYREGSLANRGTARAVNRLYEMVFCGQAASRASCEIALAILKRQTDDFGLPSQLPAEVEVAHKTGTLHGVRNDSGIIYVGKHSHVAVTVLSRKRGTLTIADVTGPAAVAEEAAANRTIGAIARLVYEYALSDMNVHEEPR